MTLLTDWLLTVLVDRLIVDWLILFSHTFLFKVLGYIILRGNVLGRNLSITVILCWVGTNTPRNVHIVLLDGWKILLFVCFIWLLVFTYYRDLHLETCVAYKRFGNLFVLKIVCILLPKRFLLVNFLIVFGILKINHRTIFCRKILTALSRVCSSNATFDMFVVVLHTNKIISVFNVQLFTEHIDPLFN